MKTAYKKKKRPYKKYAKYSTRAYALDIAAALRKRGHNAKVIPHKPHLLDRSKWVVVWMQRKGRPSGLW